MHKLMLAGLTLSAISTAQAQQQYPTRCCGIVSMTIHADGMISGRYQHPEGRLIGSMDPDGSVQGIWIQKRGFHTCARATLGSLQWGRFELQNIGTAQITGTWGYCEADPTLPWGFQNDPLLGALEPVSA